MKKIKTGKTNSILSFLIIILMFYYPLRSFGLSFAVGMGTGGILLLLYIAVRCKALKLSILNKYYLFLCILLMLLFNMPYARHDIKAVGLPIFTFAFFAIPLLFAETGEREIVKISKLLMYYGMTLSLYIIFVKFFPDFYRNSILPHLRGLDYTVIIEDMGKGYGVEVGGDSTYSDYILTIASFIGIGFFILNSKEISRKKIILFETFYFIAMLYEGRRGELISFIVSVLLFYIIIHKKFSPKQLLYIILLIAGAILFGTIVGLFLIKNQLHTRYFIRYVNTINRLKQIFAGYNSDILGELLSGRAILWKEAYSRFKASPIIGIGWGRYNDYVPYPYTGSITNVHNIILQFLCETGIIGTILLMAPILGFFREAVRSVLKIKEKDYIKYTGYILASTAAFGVQSFFFLNNLLDPCFYKSTYVIFTVISIILLNYCRRLRKHQQNLEA